MLSEGDLCNDFSKAERDELVHSFMQVDNSYYLSKYSYEMGGRMHVVPEWVGKIDERDSSHIPLIHTIVDRMEVFQDLINKNEIFNS